MREILKVLIAGTLGLAAIQADPTFYLRYAGPELAGDYGQAPKSDSTGGETPGKNSPPASADTPGTPMHDCKIGCANQCKTFANEGLAVQCRGACEAKCEATYGK